MLQRFSVADMAGLEIFEYIPENIQAIQYEPQLMSGFLEAIQRFSEEMRAPIHQIHFFNMMLYIKTYGDFSLRLILSGKLPENEIEEYFGQLAKETIFVLETHKHGTEITDKDFINRVKLILAPVIEDRFALTGSLKAFTRKKEIVKVGLAGLGQAGKSSIKKRFFDRWTSDRIKEIMPTINVDISNNFQEFLNESFTIFDFGGQKSYRISYLKKEKLWENLSALIFIVDIQTKENFEDACNYLNDVIEIVGKVNKRTPRLSIFFHKYDPPVRENSDENIQRCLSIFKNYLDKATFYLTSIEDDSCNLALVKSLYFSLPLMMLKHQLEEQLLDSFERSILPDIPKDISKDLNETELKELERQLYEKGKLEGVNLSNNLQQMWLKSLAGEWVPQRRLATSKNINLELKGQSYYVTIRDWSDEGYSKNITDAVIGGLLEGILLSFHLGKPKIIEKQSISLSFDQGKPRIIENEAETTTWEINIEEGL